VVDFVIDNNHKSVLGNHEEFINLAFTEDSDNNLIIDDNIKSMWFQNGGNTTVKSFGESFFEYLDFFSNMPLFVEHKNFLISHSYAFNGLKTPKDDVLWGRDFVKKTRKDFINIFGHTPTLNNKPMKIDKTHWNIDTCCFQTGVLTAIDLETMQIYQTRRRKYELKRRKNYL